MAIVRCHFTGENMALAMMVLVLVGAGAYVCHSAYHWRASDAGFARAQSPAALPPLFGPSADASPGAVSADAAQASLDQSAVAEDIESAPANVPAPMAPGTKRPATQASFASLGSAPLPPHRPAELGLLQDARPVALGAVLAEMSNRYDRFTAVYDLSAHVVYLPNGARLEAHSGLGDRLDDPRHVDEQDRGATPPHVYELTLREQPFHGVQALRLNPLGGAREIFGRAGLLAHTYLLGPNGDSNGCVSFKDYDAFLQAFQNGTVKQLAVVAHLN